MRSLVLATGLFTTVASLAVTTPVAGQSSSPGQPQEVPGRGGRVVPPWRMSIRADNDAFNFWKAITDRPDKEYTNGDEVSFEISSAPWWGKQFAKRRRPCRGNETADDSQSTNVTVGAP